MGAMQTSQLAALELGAISPIGQSSQENAPVLAANFPGEQPRHDVCEMSSWYVPLGHSEHVALPVSDENFPSSQASQLLWPVAD
jgi:hypothetical protein